MQTIGATGAASAALGYPDHTSRNRASGNDSSVVSNQALDALARTTQADNDSQENCLSCYKNEKTSLSIRTQEGDVVKLRFRQTTTARLTGSNGESGAADERVVSQRTGLKISVTGDLNADELAAIAAVADQASAIATAFYAGDLTAALNAAAAFEIDGAQLARAALRLRSATAVTYSGPAIVHSPAPDNNDDATAPASETPTASPAAAPAAADPTDASVGADDDTAAPPVTDTNQAAQTDDAAADNTAVGDPIGSYEPLAVFRQIVDFLTQLIDTFDDVAPPAATDAATQSPGVKIEFSLKIRIFSELLQNTSIEDTAPTDPPPSTDDAGDGTNAADTTDAAAGTPAPSTGLIFDALDILAAAGDARVSVRS